MEGIRINIYSERPAPKEFPSVRNEGGSVSCCDCAERLTTIVPIPEGRLSEDLIALVPTEDPPTLKYQFYVAGWLRDIRGDLTWRDGRLEGGGTNGEPLWRFPPRAWKRHLRGLPAVGRRDPRGKLPRKARRFRPKREKEVIPPMVVFGSPNRWEVMGLVKCPTCSTIQWLPDLAARANMLAIE